MTTSHLSDRERPMPAFSGEQTAEPTTFPYSTLRSLGNIRRLMLLPGEGDLEAALEEVSLEDDPEYASLSYSWALADGDDQKSEMIRLHYNDEYNVLKGDQTVCITKNLYDGLIRIRARRTEPIPLWVDALCINQENLVERQQQVSLMATIYKKAQVVFLWVGEDLDGDAMFAAQMIAEAKDPQPPAQLGDGIMWLTNAFETLITRRYFRRRWIVQELRHARDVVVLWNEYMTDQESFRVTLDFHRRSIGSAAGEILALFEGKSRPWTSHILVCLAEYADMECSDSRDRLYSLLSLDPGCALKADYNATADEVGCQLARYMWYNGYIEALLYNCLGAVMDAEWSLDKSDVPDGETLASWTIDVGRKFSLPNGPGGSTEYRPHQLKVQERWQRLLRLQLEGLATVQKPEHMRLVDEQSTILLSLHFFGTVGLWVWGAVKRYGPREGYRELKNTSASTTTIKVVGYWKDSRVRQHYLRSGDLVCSAAHPTSFVVVLREHDGAQRYKIVGMCQLRILNTELWQGEPTGKRDFLVV